MAPGTPRNLLNHLWYRYRYMCLLQGMIDCVIKKSRIWFFVTKILNRWMNISLSTNQFKWKRFKCKDKVVLCLSLKSNSLLNIVVKGINQFLKTKMSMFSTKALTALFNKKPNLNYQGVKGINQSELSLSPTKVLTALFNKKPWLNLY